jgi:hypothetical protein
MITDKLGDSSLSAGIFSTLTTDDEIVIRANGVVVAKFEDSGAGMEGGIEEFDPPTVMSGSQLIELARWILLKASERSREGE